MLLKNRNLLLLVALFSSFLPDAGVEAMNGHMGGHHPHGNYSPGPERGWYGARKKVRTLEDARRILLEYFSSGDIVIGVIREREWFFEAEVRDRNNSLVDIVIVDKRTGRIRSIY